MARKKKPDPADETHAPDPETVAAVNRVFTHGGHWAREFRNLAAARDAILAAVQAGYKKDYDQGLQVEEAYTALKQVTEAGAGYSNLDGLYVCGYTVDGGPDTPVRLCFFSLRPVLADWRGSCAEADWQLAETCVLATHETRWLFETGLERTEPKKLAAAFRATRMDALEQAFGTDPDESSRRWDECFRHTPGTPELLRRKYLDWMTSQVAAG